MMKREKMSKMKFSIQNLPCRGSGWKVEARRDAAPPAGHDCAWLRRRCVPTSPPSFPIATIRLWQWEDADLRRNTSTGGTQPGRRRAPTIPDLPYATFKSSYPEMQAACYSRQNRCSGTSCGTITLSARWATEKTVGLELMLLL